MDLYLHHLNSTVFLTTVALVLTIVSYLLKSTIFCGNYCKSLGFCFQYNLPTQQQIGYSSNLGRSPILRNNLPATETELSEIIVERQSKITSPTLTESKKEKDNYSITSKFI